MNIYDKLFIGLVVLLAALGLYIYTQDTPEGYAVLLGVSIGVLLSLASMWLGQASSGRRKGGAS